jgi:hypothetical protein
MNGLLGNKTNKKQNENESHRTLGAAQARPRQLDESLDPALQKMKGAR